MLQKSMLAFLCIVNVLIVVLQIRRFLPAAVAFDAILSFKYSPYRSMTLRQNV
ncbi:hypothetical protein ARMGADRAFT_1017699 [Armillaria gallica]|uniref:Uncharacterized protein n=1 Tax=Armillaria gallica TaxID=47427 RepID=A0A2H3CRG8_ARMGA|nr:hypothetical protein ARMGADRAFT_1018790 [Armillaria gallica]PBK85625.1 hypothetical protein ARMGADRAFT_1017699 [Armillaria gallica]